MTRFLTTTFGALLGVALGHAVFHLAYNSDMHFMRIIFIALGGILGAIVAYIIRRSI